MVRVTARFVFVTATLTTCVIRANVRLTRASLADLYPDLVPPTACMQRSPSIAPVWTTSSGSWGRARYAGASASCVRRRTFG